MEQRFYRASVATRCRTGTRADAGRARAIAAAYRLLRGAQRGGVPLRNL